MAKKNRKHYTAEQKYEYHKKRIHDYSVSWNKRLYSTKWVKGYTDPYAKNNLNSLEKEYRQNKKYCRKPGLIGYQGEINGMKAAVKDPVSSRKHNHEDYERLLDWD